MPDTWLFNPSVHVCQDICHNESRLFESGFQRKNVIGKPEGMGESRASQMREPPLVFNSDSSVTVHFSRFLIAYMWNLQMLPYYPVK